MHRVPLIGRSALVVAALAWLAAPCIGAETGDAVPTGSTESELDSAAAGNSIPPAPVTDLEFHLADTTSAGDPGRFPFLTWTAPGDDGAHGRAAAYRIRYAAVPITPDSWSRAVEIESLSPAAAGTRDTCSLRMVPGGIPLHFALQALDDRGNGGGLSNVCTGLVPPLDETFADTIRAPRAVVWVAGHRLPGDRLICRFANSRFFIEDVEFLPPPVKGRAIDWTERSEYLLRTPRFRNLVEGGASLEDAATVYYQEVNDLFREAFRLARTEGLDTVRSYLENHPLVERASLGEGTSARIVLKGESSGGTVLGLFPDPKSRTRPSESIDMRRFRAARQMTDRLHGYSWTGPMEVVVFLARASGIESFGRAEGELADAQARHLLEGGSLETLPEGPLRPDSRFLQDILENRAVPSEP